MKGLPSQRGREALHSRSFRPAITPHAHPRTRGTHSPDTGRRGSNRSTARAGSSRSLRRRSPARTRKQPDTDNLRHPRSPGTRTPGRRRTRAHTGRHRRTRTRPDRSGSPRTRRPAYTDTRPARRRQHPSTATAEKSPKDRTWFFSITVFRTTSTPQEGRLPSIIFATRSTDAESS